MMKIVRKWMTFSSDHDIVIAQYGELKRQVPLAYALLVVNACAVTYTHWDFAPAWLTIGVVGMLVVICSARIMRWMLAKGADAITFDEARAQLRKTTLLIGVLACAFVAWSLLLDQYGGPAERSHVALFIAVTVIGIIFCLANVPQAAMLVTSVVTLPYLIYYLILGHHVFTAMAMNIALVTGVMLRVLLNSFAGFETLIMSKGILAARRQEAERLSAENSRLAHTDALTGLPNRRYFFAEFDRQLAEARRTGRRIAVGVFDLDRFKPVNDTLGHVFGDRLLTEIGARFNETAREAALVARLGGDEFAILLTDGVDDAQAFGQAVCDDLGRPFLIDDHRITIGCSAGFAIFPDAGETVHELFDRSDYALYHVKSTRRGGCALFSIEQEIQIRSERAVELALQAADLETEMHVRFQPIVSTQTMEVLGAEALGRWTSPTVGPISPDRFIILAERLGLIDSITTTLFGKALADFEALPGSLGLSFNLSAHDIISPNIVSVLVAMIGKSPIPPERITFELTETALMRDFDAAVRGIKTLRALGAKIALDDFGTGYSSLGYLSRLPLDRVKVDRSFTANLDDKSGRNIVRAILGLCQNLGLDCVVEGVETEAQLRTLRQLDYRLAQGYLIAQPMPVDAFMVWLAQHDTPQSLSSWGMKTPRRVRS